FVVRHNGLRFAINHRRRRDATQEIQERSKKLPVDNVQQIRLYPIQQERLKLRKWMETR
ncbi:11901_t:CDS:1, partial [Ambispora gerdemannii]